MPSLNIRAGIWTRRVPWANGKYWRTDIRASVITDSYVQAARYILKDGPIIQVPLDEIRRVLEHAPTRHADSIVGPYNIDPFTRRIHEKPVEMSFGPFTNLDYGEIAALHKSRDLQTAPLRPAGDSLYADGARLLLDRIRSRLTTFDEMVERIEELNPSLRVHRNSDGSVSLSELAYSLRINFLRAAKAADERLSVKRLNLSLEESLLIDAEEKPSQNNSEFQTAADYVLQKNAELYRRLA